MIADAQFGSSDSAPVKTQEKDKFEEEEADDLINFAEGLDFDEYVGAPDRRKQY